MMDLPEKLRLQALTTPNKATAGLLKDAAEHIEMLERAEARWIGRLHDVRMALGLDARTLKLDGLPDHVALVRAADRASALDACPFSELEAAYVRRAQIQSHAP